MLQMTDIQKIYRTELVETHALRELTVSVKQGEFVAVTGASDSGKTTFLNIAGLLETFENGTYVLDGRVLAEELPNTHEDLVLTSGLNVGELLSAQL